MRVEIVHRNGKPWAVDFDCPGCGCGHTLPVRGWQDNGAQAQWEFNGNVDRPTLSPSILMRGGHYADDDVDCWCTYEKRTGEKPVFHCVVCHSFVRDGRIEFLSDCTHALAGKTVDLPEIES